MDEKKQDTVVTRPKKQRYKKPAAGYGATFFIALAVLTVVAFIIPLRPTQSYGEKRNLAQFPEFSTETLLSGEYFDDITLWFADTFPGRDSWISLANSVEELHGYSEITLYGDAIQSDTIPSVTEPEETETPATQATTAPTEAATQPTETFTAPVVETTEPPTDPVEVWGGINAGEDADIIYGNVLQIGDSAFSYFGFSQYWSDYYVENLNSLADAVADQGVNVVSALIPSAVGVMVESEYMEKLDCAKQDEAIDYMLSGMNDKIVKVDMFQNLVDHNSEYIYFRTDHHWTALGAYYCYESICQALGMEPASLDSFEQWDQGEFEGSLYWSCNQTSKLRKDNVIAYDPPGDLECWITGDNGYAFEWSVLTDMSESDISSKYMVFLAGDHAMTEITNHDLEGGPSCVLVKDSFGNPLAPFLTQNYYKVYVLDFREYFDMDLRQFVEVYDVDDIIFGHMLGMAQTEGASSLFNFLCG